MGITKSQLSAITEGFFDDETLGSDDKSGLVPRESLSTLLLLAVELVEEAKENLDNSNSNASGELSKSIEATEPFESGGYIVCEIEMNFYGEFINKGVKGTKSGSGPYSFKYDKPSEKMVKAIKKYLEKSKKKTFNTNKQSISKNEIKNISLSEVSSAYAFARSIVQKGIRKTGFMDKAIESTIAKAEDRYQIALKIDVLNSIPDSL